MPVEMFGRDDLRRQRSLQLARAVVGAGQVLPAVGTLTALTFTSAAIDRTGFWNVANPTRLTAPAAGYYLIGGECSMDAFTVAGRCLARLRVNGIDASGQEIGVIAATTIPWLNLSALGYLNRGDYLELWIGAGAGGAGAGVRNAAMWMVRLTP